MSSAPVSFDAEFQTKIAALAVRDSVFLRRADGLVKPDQFADMSEAMLVATSLEFYEKYGHAPATPTLITILLDKIKSGVLRKDLVPELTRKLKDLGKVDISDRGFLLDRLTQFCRDRAVEAAMLKCMELKEKGDFESIGKEMQKALMVGANEENQGIDYFENIEIRTQVRKEIAAGLKPPTGITTGIRLLDRELYHQGWGIGELTTFIGPPKSGKSTALAEFTKNAALVGRHALYISLEVADAIISERLDANLSGYPVRELRDRINDVDVKIRDLARKSGLIKIHQFAPGSFAPRDLKKLLDRYRAKGIIFDLVAVDYADIMAPNIRTNDPIENSKWIWIDLRAIAVEYKIALLTATQANREGSKSAVIKGTDVADDFNKIRTADLAISINRTEEEKARNEARLFFAASRNQKGEFTVRVKQDMEKMRFLEAVLGIE